MGIASLVLGIISLLIGLFLTVILGWLGGIIGIIGIILGALGRKKYPQNAGLATGGLVCSIIGTILGLGIYLLFFIAYLGDVNGLF